MGFPGDGQVGRMTALKRATVFTANLMYQLMKHRTIEVDIICLFSCFPETVYPNDLDRAIL